MSTTGWRTWTGLLLALIGAAALFLVLTSPASGPPSASSGEERRLDLTLMGKKITSFSVSEGDISAALGLYRIALPLALLFLGTFLLFLETDTGAKIAVIIRNRLVKKDE